MAQLSTIRDTVYFLINQRQNSQVYNLTTRVIPKINHVQEQICKWTYISMLSKQIYQAWDLRFLRKKVFMSFVEPKPLTADINIGDAVISVWNTTNLPLSWSVYIAGFIVNYTWLTLTSLTGCSWVIGTAKSGINVYQAIQIPHDADRSFQMYNIKENGEEREVPYSDSTKPPEYSFCFRIVSDTTTTNNFVIMTGRRQENNFFLYYYAKATSLVLDTDESIIPDTYAIEALCKIVAWELLRETEQDQQASNILALWYNKLQEFYFSYTDFHKPNEEKGKVKRNTIYY